MLFRSVYMDAKKLLQNQPLTIFSPHRLSDLFASRFLSDLSDSRLQQFHLIFLDNPQVTMGHSSQLNPLSVLPSLTISSRVPAHQCTEILDSLTQPPPNLFAEPLPDPDITMFVPREFQKGPRWAPGSGLRCSHPTESP